MSLIGHERERGSLLPDESLVVIHLHERVATVQQYIEDASKSPDVHLIAVIVTACPRQAEKQNIGALANQIVQTMLQTGNADRQ